MTASFTTKNDLRAKPYRQQLCVPEQHVVRYHSSSGSTGTPTVMAYTQADLDLLGDLSARAFETLRDKVSRWSVYNAFGYGLFTGGLSFEEAARQARTKLDLPISVIPASNQPGVSIEAAMAQHERMLKLFNPTILCSTPSLAFALWEAGLLNGIEAIITGGEPSSTKLHQLLSDDNQRQVVEVYGLSEVIGPGVAQSCHHGVLHINQDHFDVELSDDELVLTTLHNQAMPRTRFKTGDCVQFIHCCCGNPHQAVVIRGRQEDYIPQFNLYVAELEALLINHGYSPCFELTKDLLRVEPLPSALKTCLPQLPIMVLEVAPQTLPRSLGKSHRIKQTKERKEKHSRANQSSKITINPAAAGNRKLRPTVKVQYGCEPICR